MSLEDPNILEKIKAWPYLKLALTIAGLVLLIGGTLFIIDRCDAYRTKRKDQNIKDNIVNTATEMANVNAQIGNLLIKQGELKGQLERDKEELEKNVFGLDEAKQETNAAFANYNKALNTNSNVDRTLQDLEDVLKRLGQ